MATVGALVLLGPSHLPALSEFSYFRVVKIKEDVAVVRATGPDGDEEDEHEMPCAVLALRVVENSEANLWPGTFVGHPVAFVQSDGQNAGQWAYGVVTAYFVSNANSFLTVLAGSKATPVQLFDPPRTIKVDVVNYALQTGATVNPMNLNPLELLQRQDAVCASAKKRRGSSPASLLSHPTVEFNGDELIPLLRPHDLHVVHVRRQHILDCGLGPRKANHLDLYRDPGLKPGQQGRRSQAPELQPLPGLEAELLDPSEDSDTSFVGDAESIQRQNRVLGKRFRPEDIEESDSERSALEETEDFAVHGKSQGVFRPSHQQVLVHQAVSHARYKGKMPQSLLEHMQQSAHAQFLATPPVLRNLYDFGFGRGLTLMHLARASPWERMQAAESAVNMTDFSEKNSLRAPQTAASRDDLRDALRVLQVFAHHFYNQEIVALVDAAAAFVDQYAGVLASDPAGWRSMAYWITSKFGCYRNLVTKRPRAARGVCMQFSRNDESLLQLQEGLKPRNQTTSHHRPQTQYDQGRRSDRQRKKSSFPESLRAQLPLQHGLQVCLKALSNAGCSGNGRGGCFDPKRAHFRPQNLPDEAKQLITDRYGGLSPSYQDLQ